MIRKRKRHPGVGVALFPFLAVLVCTMGSLVVLLMMVVHQAQLHAQEQHQQKQQAQQAEREKQAEKAEYFQWRSEVLAPKRDEVIRKLADRRKQLSHLEDHIRRLQQRLRELRLQAKRGLASNPQETLDEQAAEQAIARRNAEIARLKQEIEELRKKAAEKEASFAIVPYPGPHGTQRRPVFLECVADKIVIQPEGIALTAIDFRAGLGPGNPLDAILRTVREYYANVEKVEPYPLLIIRPSGPTTHALARAAMRSWDDEFGYELVPDEMKLAYPPADQRLAMQMRRAVRAARQRQSALAAAMPRVRNRGPAGFIAKRRTGGGRVHAMPGRRTAGTGAGEGRGGDGQGSGNPLRPTATPGSGDQPPGGKPQAASQGGPAGKAGAAGAAGGGGAGGGGAAPPTPLTNAKGRDWALRKERGGQGYTRPLSIELATDQIAIVPRGGREFAPVVTALRGPMSRTDVERFVVGLQNHMQQWGIAAAGGYWIPILRVRVQPGAEAQYRRLELLLRGSGIQLQRSRP